ncbi:hypothetical protein SteCoe_1065 [Stentor coeruleus]|uniref:EF-hand domain-containing protein n=1 Tax=Stentor coeruleus TaxID=5963 RepID=A0A1R2D2K1_9CILI|nr:hypothetical protein SteCoe_1065 [Stentor coeruleus]
MGCTLRKPNIDQEKILGDLEESLGFSDHTSEELDLHLRKFSTNNRLNQSQLIDFLNTLKLVAWNNRKQIIAFYDKFQVEPGKYLLKPLLVMVIMMGNSPSHIKAKLIFEAYDTENSKRFSISTLQEILDLMLSISLDKLPALSEIKFYSVEIIKRYILVLNENRITAKNHMLKLLLPFDRAVNDYIYKDQFIINCYKEEPASILLTPEGLRTFIYTLNKSAGQCQAIIPK